MTKEIIEINGIKCEIDAREAVQINTYKIGSLVKVLKKEDYSDSYNVHSGMIVDFYNFKEDPILVVACIKVTYDSADLIIERIGQKNKSIKLVPMQEWDLKLSKENVLNIFDKKIAEKETELMESKHKKEFFENYFGKYLKDVEKIKSIHESEGK